MNYDYLKLKSYDYRTDGDTYVLSISKRHHIKVSKKAKIIMDSFNGKRTLNEISEYLKIKKIDFSIFDLRKFVDNVLIKNSLLMGQKEKEIRKSPLWAHIPIIDSSKLNFILKFLKNFYKRKTTILFCIIIFMSAIYNIYIAFFTNQLKNIDINCFYTMVFLIISLISHELGHVSAANFYNIDVGKIGIGIYLIFPVMYVDMTNVWKLDNKKRVVVDIGGIYFQLLLLLPLTMLYIFTQNVTYIMSNLIIIIYAIANLNPFFKLDGYWILSDYFKLDNLSSNAFFTVKNIFLKNESNFNKNKSYIFCSIIYVVSTIIVIIIGIYLSFISLMNTNIFFEKIYLLIQYIQNKDFFKLIMLTNELIKLFIPIYFVIILILTFCKFLIKYKDI